MMYGVVVPFLPERTRQMGASPLAITAVFSSYALALVLATIPAGVISDRVGRRRVIVIGGLGMVASSIAFALVDSVWLLGVTRFIQGLTGALWWVPALALVADVYPPDQRGAKLGLVMSVTGGGALLGPPFGGLLTEVASFRLPLLVMAGACFVTVVVFWAISSALPARAAAHERAPLRTALLHPTVLLVCGTALLVTIGIGMLEPLLPLHLADHFGAGPGPIGIVFGVMIVGFTVTSVIVGRLSDRVGRRGPILVGVAGVALLTPLTVVAGEIWLAALFLFLLGVAEGAMESPSLPFLAETVEGASSGTEESSQFGAVYGLFDTSFALGAFIGPLIGGALLEAISLQAALTLYAVLVAVYLPVLWWRLHETRTPGPSSVQEVAASESA